MNTIPVPSILPLLPEIPEGGVEVVAVMDGHHNGYLIHFDELAQRLRQEGCDAAGGVAGFGVHGQNVAPLQDLIDGLNEMQVHGELPGADAADPFNEPGAAVVAVDAHDIVHPGIGTQTHSGQLKVDEVHVVTQQHVGGFQPIHIDSLDLIVLEEQHDLTQQPNEPCQINGLANGVTGGIVAFLVFIIDVDIHNLSHLTVILHYLFTNCKTALPCIGGKGVL